jgi:putative methionine-R-sulfoxide reductase with GAF domain
LEEGIERRSWRYDESAGFQNHAQIGIWRQNMNGSATPDDGALAQARQTIASQAEEIERLRRRLSNESVAEELRKALVAAAVSGTISSPVTQSRLLEMIVETAAHIISAAAGALLLVDGESGDLIFEVALGQRAQEVKKLRIPRGHGIAGLVAMSGQPMAVADARGDPRHASDIAQAVGYMPQSILCVPLVYSDQIIGVLELLDKAGGAPFTAADMTVLGLFANQAAIAIGLSRAHGHVFALVGEVLGSLSGVPPDQMQTLQTRWRDFSKGFAEDPSYLESIELARLVQDIAWRGETELKACRMILQGFAGYLRSGTQAFGRIPPAHQ